MRTPRHAAAVALALLAAGPALAAHAGPPPPAVKDGPCSEHDLYRRGPKPFAGMTEAGRRQVMAAMRPDAPADRGDHDRVKTARDRMLALLSAPRLDTAAMHRAMDDEREAANAMRARRQAALLQVLQGVSLADRRAFVADARAMRGHFETMDKHMKGFRHPGGPDGGPDMPPPPPM